jgi:hypothetical protein
LKRIKEEKCLPYPFFVSHGERVEEEAANDTKRSSNCAFDVIKDNTDFAGKCFDAVTGCNLASFLKNGIG